MLELALSTITALLVTAGVVVLILRWGWGSQPPIDEDPQHIHIGSTPRIGGAAIACGLAAGALTAEFLTGAGLLLAVLLAAIPPFAAGLGEDLTQRVSPGWRYLASMLAGALALITVSAELDRFDIPLFDAALAFAPVSIVVTLFCAAGVAQAYNLSDGLNGLASGIAIIALSAIGIVAWGQSDPGLAIVAAVSAGALIGFFIFNFPSGRIFLGDGGAYLAGFLVAVLSILLVKRHGLVSAWCPLLLSAYPILETLASFFRRLLIEKTGFSEPDHLHLHSMLYNRLTGSGRRARANAQAALILLLPCALIALAAVQMATDISTLQQLAVALVILYVLAYVALRRNVQAQPIST